jgi:hypothetical protein
VSTGLEQVRERMAEFLNSRGVSAVTAWPMAPRREPERTVAVVSLRGCKVEPGGLQNYLGDRFDEETGRWEERYGRKARLTLGLDLYAPEKGDGQAVQWAFDKLVQVLLLEEPEGLAVEELSCGQTVRDGESRRLKRPVDAVCTAWLSAGTDAGGAFTDFDLRGVMKV